MRFLQRNLGERIMKSVGLIITFALLFFCVAKITSYANTYVANRMKDKKVNIQVTNKTEKKEPNNAITDSNKPMIALTFDDGPSKYTDELLAVLQANDVRATFFVLGSQVVKHPDTIAKMKQQGCEIGNHTYGHWNLTKLTPEQIYIEVEETNNMIRNVIGEGSSLLRPPYGAINDTVIANSAYPLALWSVDTTDWQSKDAFAIGEHILSTVQDGDVVLMHDIYSSTLEAMKIVIPQLKARGYQIVTFSELAKARGVTMQNGQKYFSFR